MSQTIKGLDHRCQRLELCSQQTLTAVETGNFQTASILKALSAEGEGIGADSVSTATDGSAINKKAIRLLISASRTEDERKSAGECKRILELFHTAQTTRPSPMMTPTARKAATQPSCQPLRPPVGSLWPHMRLVLNKLCSSWIRCHAKPRFWKAFDSTTCFGVRTTSQKLSERLTPGHLMPKLHLCPRGCRLVQASSGSVESRVLVSRRS
jgi:hypothetical protein